MSNFYCHPGKAGGSPMILALVQVESEFDYSTSCWRPRARALLLKNCVSLLTPSTPSPRLTAMLNIKTIVHQLLSKTTFVGMFVSNAFALDWEIERNFAISFIRLRSRTAGRARPLYRADGRRPDP